jgi:hypothetical protein
MEAWRVSSRSSRTIDAILKSLAGSVMVSAGGAPSVSGFPGSGGTSTGIAGIGWTGAASSDVLTPPT